MNIKKLVSAIMPAALTIALLAPVLQSDGKAALPAVVHGPEHVVVNSNIFSNVNVECGEEIVTVSGKANYAGELVSIMVTKKGFNVLNLTQNGEFPEEILYVDTQTTEEEGEFSFDVALEPGIYTVILNGYDHEQTTLDFEYDKRSSNTYRIYVSPDGDNSNQGTFSQPLQTLQAANTKAQPLIAQGDRDVEIILREGTYWQTSTINYGAAYAGKNGNRFIVRAYPNEKVVFDYSRQLTGWADEGDGIYSVQLEQNDDPAFIFEKGNHAYKARYPNRDGQNQYIRVAETPDGIPSNNRFKYAQGDFPEPSTISGLQIFIWPGGDNGHYNWNTTIRNVVGLDKEERLITLHANAGYTLGAGSRYFIQGAREFLDAQGEFWKDSSDNKLYYKPYNAANLETSVFMPYDCRGININATQNITIKGITFQGNSFDKSLANRNTMIRCGDVSGVEVIGCRINNAGYRGITLEGGSTNNLISDNLITNTVSDGISIVGVDKQVLNHSGNNIVENNLVKNVGLLDGNAGNIRIYNSDNNIIRYNKVSGSPRYGLHIKGNTRANIIGSNAVDGTLITKDNFRDYQRCVGNILEFNDVSDCVKDSQDCGAIATWGINLGNVIRNNYVHDNHNRAVTANPVQSFIFVIYNDEDSGDILIENNILTDNWPLGEAEMRALVFPRGEDGITIRNNYFIGNPEVSSTMYYDNTYNTDKGDGNYGCFDISFENNLVTGGSGTAYWFADNYSDTGTFPDDGRTGIDEALDRADNNLYNDTAENINARFNPRAATPNIIPMPDWSGKYGYDANSIFVPNTENIVMNIDKKDYRLVGEYSNRTVAPINMADIGLKADFPFTSVGAVDRVFAKTGGKDVSETTLPKGISAQFNISWRDTNGFIHYNADVQSSNPEVAYYENGQIRTVTQGSSTLTVIPGGDATKSITYVVNVTDSINPRLENGNRQTITHLSQLTPGEPITVLYDGDIQSLTVAMGIFNNSKLIALYLSKNGESIVLGQAPEQFDQVSIKLFLWDKWLRPTGEVVIIE